MATISHTEGQSGTQFKTILVEGMDAADISDAIEGSYWSHAWIFAVDGGSAVNPNGKATIDIQGRPDGTSAWAVIAEDANNVKHLRCSISTAGVVTAGHLEGPIPNRIRVLLNDSGGSPVAADWDIYILLQSTPTYDRGK